MATSSSDTLLLVDDDPRNLIALGALLEPFGHRLVTAHGGRAAIELFEREVPQLVLCDYAMPECDGLAVLRAIRGHARRGDTPVVIVTAYAEREHRLNALQAGADDFLEKPIDAAVLTARVRTLLGLQHSRDALHRAKNELAFRHEVLKRLQAEQRELVSFLLHDLKVPITALQLALDACQRTMPPDEVACASALHDATAAARRIARMSEDLVSISQLEDEGFPVRLSHVRLEQVVDEVMATCRSRLGERRVDVVARQRPDAEVVGDPGLLRRVLENLFDNAIRHTLPVGRVRVEVEVDGCARLLLSNDGPPLSARDDATLFEKKYVPGPDARSPLVRAGLGLYFCKRAMSAQHGDIAIIDVPGWPASFELTLPTAAQLGS